MKGHTFKITLGLIEEVLPGLDVYLRFTLARENLSPGAESTRGYFIQRLDVLTKKPYEVWDRVPREFEIEEPEPPPPKVPPRIRKNPIPYAGRVNGAEPKMEKKCDDAATARVSAPEEGDSKCASTNQTDSLKPSVPPKPEHLVTLVRSRSRSLPRSGYYNHSRMKPPEADGGEKSDSEEKDVTLGDVTLTGSEVKVEEEDGGYEPIRHLIGVENDSSAILDSNANIDMVNQVKEDSPENSNFVEEESDDVHSPGRKLSNVSVQSQDSALGFNLDIPKIDCKSMENMLAMDLNCAINETPTLERNPLVEPVVTGVGESPPVLPKRPQFLTVAKPKVAAHPTSSPRLVRESSPSRSPHRVTTEDVPPPLPPRKRVLPPVGDGQPEAPPSDVVGVEPPPLPPLPPRPNEALGLLTQREGETEEEFVARQRMIARSNVVEEEEEGDYDTIDKSDGEEGGKSAEKKKKKKKEVELLGMIKRKFHGKLVSSRESLRDSSLYESDATSYESYDELEEQPEINSSQENIIDPVLASKENLTSSPYSLTFPRFRSFRKSKRKANKGSMDNVSLFQHGAATFSGELQYKGKYQWTRRFCIVTADEFLCYKTERDSRPALSFALKDFDVAYIEKEGKKHHVIRLSHPGFDTHLFSVDSKDRADMWIEQFNSVGRNVEKNRMSAGSLDGVRTEDGSSTSTPSQLNSHNSLSNISQTSSTSDSTDTHSYALAPSMSGSQYSVTSMIVGSKESSTPSPLSKQAKRPLSTPSSHDIINRAIVLSNPSTPADMKQTPSPGGRRHSAHHLSNQKSKRTSQIFGSWGKKKTKKSTPSAEPSAPMNFEVYEGSSYDVTVSGYMNVKSQLSSHSPDWTKKYCRIKNGFFECYKDIADYRHEFNFPLVGCEIVTAREAHRDLAIKVVQGDIEKVFIEPGNTLEQGRWLAVLIKETTCCSQPPPGSDDDDMDVISPMVLSPSSENLDEKVFFENEVRSDPGSDASDGYEQQAINRNSFSAHDEFKDTDSENGYIENYGPEVLAVREALAPDVKTGKNPDDGHMKIKEERLKSDSEIVVRPKSKILDVYAKVEKRDSRLSALVMEEASSKRSSVASEYDDILSAVMKVSRKFSDGPTKPLMSRSLSFDTGKSLKAAAEKIRDFDAIAAKEYESFQELHNSRQGSCERELQDSSGGTNSIEGAVLSAGQDESTVIAPPCGDSETNGATIDLTLSDKSPIIHKKSGKSKKSGSHRPRSEMLYPEISNSFGSLDEISSDSSLDDDSSVARTLPNLDEEKQHLTNKFYEISDRKKDSGICGDSNESISALIKDEGVKVRDDARAQLREHGEDVRAEDNSEKRRTTDSIDKVLAGTFVNTATSVYAKEVPVNVDDSDGDKHSSHGSADESDHEYDDIDEKKRNSYLPADGATGLTEDSQSKCDNEGENVYDEIDKENEGEGQSAKVVVEVQNSKVVAIGDEGAKAGSDGHHDYADVDDKEKIEGVVEEESDHDYDPIEFKGAGGEGDEGRVSSESEYEEYEDPEEEEEESIESKQRRAAELHAEVRVKKKEWAQLKKLRLALENQRIQSRDPEEKKRLIIEYNDLDVKVKVIEVELAAMVEEHRTLSSAVAKHFHSHGLLGRKMSAISIESFMMMGK